MPRESTFAPEMGSWLPTARMLSSRRRKIAIWSPPTRAHTPVPGTMSSSRQTLCKLGFLIRRIGLLLFGARGPQLPSLGDEHYVAIGLIAIHEVAKARGDLRRIDGLLPLAFVARDVPLHVGLELGADAEGIV